MTEEELLKQYAEVQKAISDLLVKAFYSDKNNATVRRIVNSDVDRLINALTVSSATFVSTAVPENFILGIESTLKDLLTNDFITRSAIQFEFVSDFGKAPKNFQEVVTDMIAGYESSFDDALRAAKGTTKQNLNRVLGLKRTIDQAEALSATERAISRDIVKKALTQDAFGSKGIDQISREVAKEFRKNVQGNFETMFRDKAGRRWSFQRYANMVTGDIRAQANRQGQVEQFLDLGLDLVRISWTGTPDSCLPYEGIVISLTGKTPGVPSYEELIGNSDHIFGVQCHHQLLYLSSEEAQEYLDKK